MAPNQGYPWLCQQGLLSVHTHHHIWLQKSLDCEQPEADHQHHPHPGWV